MLKYRNVREIYRKTKKLYKNLKSCFCNSLNEEVYFTSDGLNHVLYYRRRPRSQKERYYRAGLIKHLIKVITQANSAMVSIKSTEPKVVTWAITYKLGQKEIKVILRKIGNGKLHFLSVMAKKTTKKPKKRRAS